ncbi:hypothetical protein J6590_002814 [Homalodisca vitripennis]|nr:hypothetical protein J6590_002814 [Homalodisca vitripennis]
MELIIAFINPTLYCANLNGLVHPPRIRRSKALGDLVVYGSYSYSHTCHWLQTRFMCLRRHLAPHTHTLHCTRSGPPVCEISTQLSGAHWPVKYVQHTFLVELVQPQINSPGILSRVDQTGEVCGIGVCLIATQEQTTDVPAVHQRLNESLLACENSLPKPGFELESLE